MKPLSATPSPAGAAPGREDHTPEGNALPNRAGVLVWHRRAKVAAELAGWVKRAGVRALDVHGPSPDLSGAAAECEIAVAGISGERSEAPGIVCGLREFSRRGMTVIGCVDPGPPPPLADRCRYLLAGCACLLERQCAEFGSELAGRVASELRAAGERKEEESALRAEMARHGVVGSSPGLLGAFRALLRAAKFGELPVLITGETGTGKELVARALHALDPARRVGTFVALNAGALNAQLAESELFGHRRGAFTGADRDRPGLFRTAHHGTLFLDEIAELDLAVQAKLLRVLQDGRLYGLGDDREVTVDVRVVAATHRPLEELVQTGAFREDLFHRLSVFRIQLPPLRDRIGDLGALVDHCLARLGERRSGCPVTATAEYLEALGGLHLHGNIRELEGLVRDSALDRTDGRPLTLADLPARALERITARSDSESALGAVSALPPESGESEGESFVRLARSQGWNLATALQHVERQVIESALREANGSQARAARLLGITPRTIYNKLRKHGLAS